MLPHGPLDWKKRPEIIEFRAGLTTDRKWLTDVYEELVKLKLVSIIA